MLKNILLGAGIFATLFSVLIFSGKLPIGQKAAQAQGDVQVWGTLPESDMNAFVSAFNPKAKTYAVRYTYVSPDVFNQKLLEALASGSGPDMIIAPYQTILSQAGRIQAYPAQSFNETSFKNAYVDGASILYSNQGALALPISIEPMVLFYNRTLLSKHGVINPPATWYDITQMTPNLTVRENGKFVESAISLGSPTTPYAKDIIMTMIEQLGQTPVLRTFDPSGNDGKGKAYYAIKANDPAVEGGEVLPLATVSRYFAQFGDPGQTTYTWGPGEGDASDKFVAEKLAMYVGYSGELNTLRERNPRADFGMAVLPQMVGYNTFATGMRLYGIATLKSSKNMLTALTVESQLGGADIAPTLAAMVGGVSPLRSSVQSINDQVLSKSILVARGWYDSHEKESANLISTMISDIINYRYGVNDASSIFISRMRDLYAND